MNSRYIRVYEIANALNMKSNEVIAILVKNGIQVKSPQSKILSDSIKFLLESYPNLKCKNKNSHKCTNAPIDEIEKLSIDKKHKICISKPSLYIPRKDLWSEFNNRLKEDTNFLFNNSSYLSEDIKGAITILNQIYSTKLLKDKITLYRSRIIEQENLHFSNKKGIIGYTNFRNVSAPPKDKTRSGRVNFQGERYVYTASNITTSIAEIRPAFCDYVNIAIFSLKKDLEILDFTKTVQTCNCSERHKIDFIERLIEQYSLPVTEGNELKYLPTQAFTKYIREKYHIDGIKYKSRRCSSGNNIVVFDERNLQLIETKVFRINNISYTAQNVNDFSTESYSEESGELQHIDELINERSKINK